VHEHEILGIRWNDNNLHVHQYSTETTINNGHSHFVQGTTTPANFTMDHVHYYEGNTTFVGHVHHFSGDTGPPIYLNDGTHYHEFSGTTTFNDGHVHYYSGFTGRNIS
jgi:hypothetical protein